MSRDMRARVAAAIMAILSLAMLASSIFTILNAPGWVWSFVGGLGAGTATIAAVIFILTVIVGEDDEEFIVLDPNGYDDDEADWWKRGQQLEEDD